MTLTRIVSIIIVKTVTPGLRLLKRQLRRQRFLAGLSIAFFFITLLLTVSSSFAFLVVIGKIRPTAVEREDLLCLPVTILDVHSIPSVVIYMIGCNQHVIPETTGWICCKSAADVQKKWRQYSRTAVGIVYIASHDSSEYNTKYNARW